MGMSSTPPPVWAVIVMFTAFVVALIPMPFLFANLFLMLIAHSLGAK